ncbi:hypothetical protein DYST_01620 [Dyella terrae]|nr:hypothetical protein DYST_01620 [Dyella terrae]
MMAVAIVISIVAPQLTNQHISQTATFTSSTRRLILQGSNYVLPH